MTSIIHQFFIIIIQYCIINHIILNVTCDNNESSISDMFRALSPNKMGNLVLNYLNSIDKNVTFNISNECSKQVSIFLNDISNYEPWTLKMIDASSKIPSGILEGNIKDIGMYDECMSVNVIKDNITIVGRHCMYTLSIDIRELHQIIEPTLSICSLSACKVNDVNHLLQYGFDIATQFMNYTGITIKSITCSDIDATTWDTGTIITISLLGLLICFLIICTIFDCYVNINGIDIKKNVILNAMCKFSIYTNGKRIFNTSVSRNNIPVISGLRFFSMCYMILGHTYYHGVSELIVNRLDPLQWARSWSALYILVGHFAVDTFLVMSGILASYIFLKELNNNYKLKVLYFYVQRWVRLTPILGILILFAIYIFPKFGSGPMWDAPMTDQSNYCSRNWWKLLLYIQNFGSSENLMCLSYTWYLAVDMQLFWISPFILIPLKYNQKFGLVILGLFIIASIIIPAAISVTNKYSWSLLFKLDEVLTADMMSHYYVPSYTRAAPYLQGIFVGYVLVYKKYVSNNMTIRIGWLLTVLSFIFSILSWRIFQMENYEYNIYWELFYTGLSQHIWSFGICWIIYVSAIGHGGVIGSFLSLPIFLPFSRISYCVYLLHFVIQTMKVNATRTPKYFSNFYMIDEFMSNFLLSIMFGFIFSLIFESPFLTLKKLLTNKIKNNNNKLTNVTLNNAMSNGIVNNAYEINEI